MSINRLNIKDKRTDKQILEHYEIERKLADKLRNAPKEERGALYASVYDEFFRTVPDLPTLARKGNPALQQEHTNGQMKLINSLVRLDENYSFLEIGPGDCALALHLTGFVKEVFAVDVSKTITENSDTPNNFKLLISDGSSIPVPANSIDIIYSNQLMEHIHPDDAHDQLKNIFQALKIGGKYLCSTPNRLNGPHDISKYFDTVATGFHLKEYTNTELNRLFKNVGFSKVMMHIGGRGVYLRFPLFLAIIFEGVLDVLPSKLRYKLGNTIFMRILLNIRLLGVK